MTNKYTLVTNTEENKQKIHVEDHWKTHAEDINFGNWNVLGNWIFEIKLWNTERNWKTNKN